MPAVTLIVAKQSGVNTVATADEVKQRLKEISAALPPDIKAQVISDQSVFIKAAVDNIKQHLIEGSFFAAIIIFLFLANIRTTLIAAIAIPTSIISTFALMAAMGFTLNQITMLALTLMVGIVIDDAIIVLENIYRFIEEKDMPPFQAADPGHQGNRPRRDGHHLEPARRVPAGGLHGRHRGPLHELVRFHLGLRHRGFAAGLLHADADALLALHQAARAARRSRAQHSSKDSFIFKYIDIYYTRMLTWSMAHRGVVVALSVLRDSVDRSALHVRRQELPAAGRPVAVQRSDPHSRRHFARRHHQLWPSASHRRSAACPAWRTR